MKNFGGTIIGIVITVLAAGGLYYYFNQKITSQKSDLTSEVDSLKDKISSLEANASKTASQAATADSATASTTGTPASSTTTPTTSTTTPPAQTTTAATDWKTFTSNSYNYTVKYPTDWQYKDTTAAGSMNTISFKPKTATETTDFDVVIQKSNLDYSIAQVKKQYSAYTYKDKTTVTIDGKAFTVLDFESKDGKTKPAVYLLAKEDLVYYFAAGASTDSAINVDTAEMVKSFQLTK